MNHITFSSSTSDVNTAILIKSDSLNKSQLEHFYIKPLERLGLVPDNFIAFDLYYPTTGNLKAAEAKQYCNNLLKALDSLNITTLIVCDSTYFKYLTGITKTSTARGYVKPCSIYPYKHMNVILSSNYNAIYHNDSAQIDIDRSLTLLHSHLTNNGSSSVNLFQHKIIESEAYPDTLFDIHTWLQHLSKYPMLSCDIETYSLRFEKAGIGTIGFAWDMHNGIAFSVDPDPITKNEDVRIALKEFFINYKGTLLFHNILFDAKILIYQLFMKDDADWEGMQEGLEVFSKHDDTLVLAFLATNHTGTNNLGLKELSYEYLGNYAIEDINDITKVDRKDLLKYNLVDCLGTWYVYNKYLPIVHAEDQYDFYINIGKPSLKVAIRMMLTGLPMDLDQVSKVEDTLRLLNLKHKSYINQNIYVQRAQFINNKRSWEKANAKLKKKVKPLSDFNDPFNPNSDLQLRVLLYEVLNLPVLDTTDSGEPSTSSKIIKRLKDHPGAEEHLGLLNALIGVAETEIIINTFITAFKEYAFTRKTDNKEFNDTVWLNGNLKTTGTKSGRMSSNEPNLTNLPSNSAYGKAVKECFVAPEGWLFCFADFNALEARINAILTNDPNKIKVFSQGFDSHCLNASFYYKDQMPDIDINDVNSVNSVKDRYSALRNKSKSCTFALNYGGTWMTLVSNLGFSKEEATSIEARYHKLYEISDIHADTVTASTAYKGHIELAFGLKLRAPILKKTMMGVKKLPSSAAAEARTINNAESQSYGLLLNRALIELDHKLSKDNMYLNILPINCIHDAAYFIVKNTPEAIKWLNDNLIESMSWQKGSIVSKDVSLGAELDIGRSWANTKTLHNNATLEEVEQFLENI